MTVLIDYYNLNNSLKEIPLSALFDFVLNNITFQTHESFRTISFRLYGGWLDHNRPTRKAQELAVEIEKGFPTVFFEPASNNKFILNSELAYSLICEPYLHLFYTYRTRGVYYGLKVKSSDEIGCFEKDCPYDLINTILNSNKCPKCSQPNAQANFYRSEQKLVDSMIASDLIFLSTQGLKVVLITSDDDIWPAILTGISMGGEIIHIETKNHTKEFNYRDLLNSSHNYSFINIGK